MSEHPLRLILTGYALMAAVAVALAVSGGGILGPVLVFWLGGAVAVIGLALMPGICSLFRSQVDLAHGEDAGPSLTRWSIDQLADIAQRPDAVSRRKLRLGR